MLDKHVRNGNVGVKGWGRNEMRKTESPSFPPKVNIIIFSFPTLLGQMLLSAYEGKVLGTPADVEIG